MTGYTGHVEPQGEPATRILRDLMITKLSVGPMDNNSYLLTDRSSGDAMLVDAANDAERIERLIGNGLDRPRLVSILTTHRHPDHWQALEALARKTSADLFAGAREVAELPVPTDVALEHGDWLPLGKCWFGVIELRGHTPGSIALVYGDPDGIPHLFSGDSLFPGGPGKTTTPETFNSLMNDLEARVFAALPDETWVYPGHGDDTTLGAERPHLAEWRARGW